MKKVLLLVFFCFSTQMYSQSNDEVAKIYLNRAEKNFNSNNTAEAIKAYSKAMKYIDLETTSDISIPKLGMVLYSDIKDYNKAKEYSKNYFRLVTDKTSDEYLRMLELYVDIVDNIEEGGSVTQPKQPARAATTIPANSRNTNRTTEPQEVVSERIKTSYSRPKKGGYTQLELAEEKAYPSTIIADRTYPFNANGIAVFEESGKLGLINDQGRVFLYPEEYKDFVQYEGYIILKNRKVNPSKLYCFNSNINFGFILPPVREYNGVSTHFGEVMMPRANGILVTYPDKSLNIMKFDLNRGEFIVKSSPVDMIKALEKLGGTIEHRINRKENILEVKMGTDWVVLGSHLGGDIYPLFRKDYSIYGYAFNKSDSNSEKRVMSHLGPFFDEKIQASSSKDNWWLDRRSRLIKPETVIEKKYKGAAQIIEVSAGTYKVQTIVGRKQ